MTLHPASEDVPPLPCCTSTSLEPSGLIPNVIRWMKQPLSPPLQPAPLPPPRPPGTPLQRPLRGVLPPPGRGPGGGVGCLPCRPADPPGRAPPGLSGRWQWPCGPFPGDGSDPSRPPCECFAFVWQRPLSIVFVVACDKVVCPRNGCPGNTTLCALGLCWPGRLAGLPARLAGLPACLAGVRARPWPCASTPAAHSTP